MSNNTDPMKLQLIVTGRSISPDEAMNLRSFLTVGGFFATEFIHPNGEIGHFDSTVKEVTWQIVRQELTVLANTFKQLELGISLMTGPPGAYNRVLKSYLVKNGVVKEDTCPHIGHGPPKRYKKI